MRFIFLCSFYLFLFSLSLFSFPVSSSSSSRDVSVDVSVRIRSLRTRSHAHPHHDSHPQQPLEPEFLAPLPVSDSSLPSPVRSTSSASSSPADSDSIASTFSTIAVPDDLDESDTNAILTAAQNAFDSSQPLLSTGPILRSTSSAIGKATITPFSLSADCTAASVNSLFPGGLPAFQCSRVCSFTKNGCRSVWVKKGRLARGDLMVSQGGADPAPDSIRFQCTNSELPAVQAKVDMTFRAIMCDPPTPCCNGCKCTKPICEFALETVQTPAPSPTPDATGPITIKKTDSPAVSTPKGFHSEQVCASGSTNCRSVWIRDGSTALADNAMSDKVFSGTVPSEAVRAQSAGTPDFAPASNMTWTAVMCAPRAQCACIRAPCNCDTAKSVCEWAQVQAAKLPLVVATEFRPRGFRKERVCASPDVNCRSVFIRNFMKIFTDAELSRKVFNGSLPADSIRAQSSSMPEFAPAAGMKWTEIMCSDPSATCRCAQAPCDCGDEEMCEWGQVPVTSDPAPAPVPSPAPTPAPVPALPKGFHTEQVCSAGNCRSVWIRDGSSAWPEASLQPVKFKGVPPADAVRAQSRLEPTDFAPAAGMKWTKFSCSVEQTGCMCIQAPCECAGPRMCEWVQVSSAPAPITPGLVNVAPNGFHLEQLCSAIKTNCRSVWIRDGSTGLSETTLVEKVFSGILPAGTVRAQSSGTPDFTPASGMGWVAVMCTPSVQCMCFRAPCNCASSKTCEWAQFPSNQVVTGSGKPITTSSPPISPIASSPSASESVPLWMRMSQGLFKPDQNKPIFPWLTPIGGMAPIQNANPAAAGA